MCGRFSQGKGDAIEQLLSGLNLSLSITGFTPRWNIAPSAQVSIIKHHHNDVQSGLSLEVDEWGMVPAWMQKSNITKPLINARSETVFEKPAFKSSIKSRRCVVPIEGFYEWQKTTNGKQPWYMYHEDNSALALAGIYQISPDGVSQFCLLTTHANKMMKDVHHRMPVILTPEQINDYLSTDADDKLIKGLAKANDNPLLTRQPVSSFVSSARNDGQRCIEPANL
jgi:putative SOS response-associated peptidase YedK